MDALPLRDLRLIAEQHGVVLPSGCTCEEAVLFLRPVVDAAECRQQALHAATAGSLAVAVLVGRSFRDHDPEGYYACLGLALDAAQGSIKTSHRAKSLLLHEDRHAGQGPEMQQLAKEMQQRVNSAKEVLSDPAARSAYHHQGAAGVARAALVTAQPGTKEFLENLDLVQKREKLLQLHRELEAHGTTVIRFNALRTFEPLTDRIHAMLTRMGYNWEGEEEDYDEEEEEEEEEDEEAQGEESEEVSAEGESGSEEEAEEGAGGSVVQGSQLRVAQVTMDGKPTYVILPDEATLKRIKGLVEQQKPAPETQENEKAERPSFSGLSFYDKMFLAGETVLTRKHVDTAVLQDTPPGTLRKAATSALGFGFVWPKVVLPHATQVYLTHSFTFPWGAKNLFSMSCGGPQAWFAIALKHVASSLEEFKAKVNFKVGKTHTTFSWLRRLSQYTNWALKYKVGAANNAARISSTLESKLDTKVDDQARLSAAVTMSPADGEKKLAWEYTKWDQEGNSATWHLELGWLSLGHGVMHRLVLPRRNADTNVGGVEDEDEAEAVSSLGNLTTMVSQDVISGTSRVSWRAMFHTSRKSTQNQIGFGVSSSLPYATLGVAVIPANNDQSTTEFELILQRNRFSLRIPLLITTASDVPTVASYMILPLLVFKTGLELVKRPWDRMKRRSDFLKKRQAIKAKLWQDRQRAISEQDLLKDEAKRRGDEEIGVGGGGLVIQNAKYGCLHAPPEDDEALEKEGVPPRVLDVTTSLQAEVQESRLLLNAGPKHRYDGFYDVDPEGDEERYLRVRYIFLGEPHEVEILECMELVLPLQEHRLDYEHDSPRKHH